MSGCTIGKNRSILIMAGVPHNKVAEVSQAYKGWKNMAEKRGRIVDMTAVEYWNLMEPHWDNRRKLHLCVCRFGDMGDYTVDNVYVDSRRNNMLDYHKFAAHNKKRKV